MTRVHFLHNPGAVAENTGIGRVLHAQFRYLPEYDIELVGSPDQADVIVAHAEGYPDKRIDVLHCHGIYWTGDRGSGIYSTTSHQVNQRIAHTARRVRRVTVPSAWVAEPFLRDMRIQPVVIPHGIDLEQWGPAAQTLPYALWNKNRAIDVCDPLPAVELAARGIPVLATFTRGEYPTPPSMRIIGLQTQQQMKGVLGRAGVYLATTPETFGVGTLEALACGVPVLGYRWGGTADIIRHLETGYLVEPGNFDDLAEGYTWLMANRERVSEACQREARRYTWDHAIRQYADLYHEVAEEMRTEERGVSIIITNYNYGKYVRHAIDSCLQQTRPPDEIIVVDDGSTDDSATVLDAYAALPTVTVVRQNNRGVAAARNRGIEEARQAHIICLDADDMLEPRCVQTLLPLLQQDRGLGIAYGGLAIIGDDNRPGAPQPFPPPFRWEQQAKPGNPPHTCVPCAAMFRRDMWERAGGFQQVWAPGEDAEFWTRGLSIGFEALKATEEPLLWYRIHGSSASREKIYKPVDTWMPWMRDGDYPFAAPATKAPIVRSYANPLVSVRITLRNGQQETLRAALDSIVGQTMREWEVIIDMPHPVHDVDIRAYPFVRIWPCEPRAPFMLRMTAGQYLPPTYLEDQLRAYIESGELKGGLAMCGCAKKSPAPRDVQRTLSAAPQAAGAEFGTIGIVEPGIVKVRYLGENSAPRPLKSPKTRQTYLLTKRNPVIDALDEDVAWLMSYRMNDRSPMFEIVPINRPPELPRGVIEPTVPDAVRYDPEAVDAEPEAAPVAEKRPRRKRVAA